MMRLKIEPMSPIFIGSGEKVTKFEMLIRGDRTYILDFDKLMNDDKFVEEFVNRVDRILNPSEKDKALEDIFRKLNINIDTVKKHDFKTIIDKKTGKPRTLQIHTFISSAGRKYIPGSSLKGAIRTALIKQYLSDKFAKHLESRYRNVENEIFGDAKKSVFKFLQISDSTYINSKFIAFKMYRILNILKQKGSIPQFLEIWLPKKVTNIPEENYVECTLEFKTSWYRKNQSAGTIRAEGKITHISSTLEDKQKFIAIMKEIAKNSIEREKTRISQMIDKNAQQQLMRFYDELSKENQKDNVFVLRVGGHSGFYSKTAFTKPLTQAQIETLRKINRHWKFNPAMFPVTVRVVDVNASTIMPLGWLKVTVTN
ncbi:MAG: type III-A CRISPR-associated RAMP protein Csm5 [Fervidobacterium sp.]|uniref:type III-A CRISPR-associated RAMP protein Csm5 n=1 Tax=Fervidobacterium sp. TaxID=1871331 RepID=UPI0030B4701E